MIETNKLACRSPEDASSNTYVSPPKATRTKINQGTTAKIKTIITATMKRRALKPRTKAANASPAKQVSP
jgi:hypothetical protein